MSFFIENSDDIEHFVFDLIRRTRKVELSCSTFRELSAVNSLNISRDFHIYESGFGLKNLMRKNKKRKTEKSC